MRMEGLRHSAKEIVGVIACFSVNACVCVVRRKSVNGGHDAPWMVSYCIWHGPPLEFNLDEIDSARTHVYSLHFFTLPPPTPILNARCTAEQCKREK